MPTDEHSQHPEAQQPGAATGPTAPPPTAPRDRHAETAVPYFIHAAEGRFQPRAGYFLACAAIAFLAYRTGWLGLLPLVPVLAWFWLRRADWLAAERAAGRTQVKWAAVGWTTAAPATK